jgi:hypothetical protein
MIRAKDKKTVLMHCDKLKARYGFAKANIYFSSVTGKHPALRIDGITINRIPNTTKTQWAHVAQNALKAARTAKALGNHAACYMGGK